VLVTVAAGIAVLGLLLGAVPPVRDAVAGWLGLRGITIERRHTLPTPARQTAPPSATGTASVGARLDLGELLPLAEARSRVLFPILIPSALGPPDQVYLRTPPSGGAVSLVYLPRPGLPDTAETGVGLLITEFRGSYDTPFLGKLLGGATSVEPVTVAGAAGYWIAGAPHELVYRDMTGNTLGDTIRLAANTLIWERGDLTLRLESSLGREPAIATGAGLR
jgi:hypothetical protein